MKQRFTCSWIFDLLVVLSDGKVVCGCADPNGERPLGNIHKDKLYDIWNSDLVKSIRKGLNEGYSSFCENCGIKTFIDDDTEIEQRPEVLEVLPRLFIEPTVLCNLSCYKAVCGGDSDIVKTRSKASMSMEDFIKIMEQTGDKMIRVDLFNYGDPFVNPLAVDMAEHIKKNYPGIYLYISTNGLMLDEGKIERLVDAGVDEITFSLDGADQETYEKYRCGGEYIRAVELLSTLVKKRDAAGREVPFINWRYIIFNWNDSAKQMKRAVKIAEKTGADRFTWEITDHPAEAKSEKYQPETEAWKKIYYEIWDTSQIGNAIKKKRFAADIKPPFKEYEMLAGEEGSLKVRVKNRGGALWLKSTHSGRRWVRLGAQLHDSAGNMIDLNYARAFMESNIPGGKKEQIEIKLPPIVKAGDYLLKFDMVSEGNDWFENGGSPVKWMKLTVKSR